MIKSRFYKGSDKARCLKIFQSNIGLYFAKEEVIDFENFLDEQINNNHYLVFFAESEPEKLLACGGFGELEQKIFLRWGMVEQSVHKQGLGTQLLSQRLEAIEQQLGKVDIYIDTSQYAQGFYEKYGFKVISTIQDGFAPNIDKVRMRLSDII